MERKREMHERCFLEVFRGLKAPNSKSNSEQYFMACGIKKKNCGHFVLGAISSVFRFLISFCHFFW